MIGTRIADALGTVYEGVQFTDLFPRRGQPVEAPSPTAPTPSYLPA